MFLLIIRVVQVANRNKIGVALTFLNNSKLNLTSNYIATG